MTRQEIELKWQALKEHFDSRGADGAAVVSAFKEVYAMYTEALPKWLAGLYDHKTGGFYYSNSARDNEPFLPDIESTNQAVNLLVNSGMVSSPDKLPDAMKKKMAEFVCSLLDPDDGYIYHPQWGKDISNSRRGRDLMWAVDMSKKLGFALPYPTANDRLKALAAAKTEEEKKAAASVLPEHLTSKEKFIQYLESFDWEKDSYYAGNTVAAQGRQIIAAGLADTCVEYLNRFQNPKNGYWSEKSDMHYGINGFLKITAFYIDAGAPINMAELAADSTIALLTSDEIGTTVCHLYNCYYALYNILRSLRKVGDNETADRVAKKLIAVAPEAIRSARFKTEVFRKADGAFSYHREYSAFKSQQAWVAVQNTPESDVNASVLCTSGLINNIYQAFDAGEYRVPLFSDEDYEIFLANLKLD
ncbi:MAG: hypothetical protein J6D20_05850 [Clostridia bacterium]|nr:hypothetical protein [Clostridia bacterium]